MGSFRVLLHDQVAADFAGIPRNMADRILNALEGRLGADPGQYGQRLRQALQGYWKMRVGDYRAVYEIVGREVRVYGIMHRREVYDRIVRRLARGWPQSPGQGGGT